MSMSHCMGRALEIAKAPRETWGARIAELPNGCEHHDCGAPRNCRERIAEYLRMQWRIADRRSRIVADRAGGGR